MQYPNAQKYPAKHAKNNQEEGDGKVQDEGKVNHQGPRTKNQGNYQFSSGPGHNQLRQGQKAKVIPPCPGGVEHNRAETAEQRMADR